MSAPTTLALLSREPHFDGPRPSTDDQLLLRIVASFSVECTEGGLYSEPEFPVVELASALQAWRRTPDHVRADFTFESMEAEERGLVWIRKSADGWRVGSARQTRAMAGAVSLGEIEFAVRQFIRDVTNQARHLGCDVTRVIERGIA